jgi:hypothetical protein
MNVVRSRSRTGRRRLTRRPFWGPDGPWRRVLGPMAIASAVVVAGCSSGDSIGDVLAATTTVAPTIPGSASGSSPTPASAADGSSASTLPTKTTASGAATTADPTGSTTASTPLEAFEVIGLDYEFRHAATIPSTELVRFRNMGAENHELVFGRIVDGATMADVLAAPDFSAVVPDSVVAVAEPGQTAEVAVSPLEPGSYILVCYVATAAGEAHVDLGMVSTVEVVSSG